jgi:hypothetical protein
MALQVTLNKSTEDSASQNPCSINFPVLNAKTIVLEQSKITCPNTVDSGQLIGLCG